MAQALSIIDYICELKNAGFSEQQAEVQARKLEQVILEVKNDLKEEFQQKGLAQKSDIRESELRLQKEIKELELQINANISKAKISTIMWVGIFFISNGLLIHFLK